MSTAEESITIDATLTSMTLGTAVVNNVAALLQSDAASAADRSAVFATVRRSGRPSQYAYSHRKRAIDIVVSAMMLCLVLPVMVCLAIAIKATSAGPILFRQQRGGHAGRPFTILKFRTMTWSSCEAAIVVQATRDDPRITKVGRLLRQTSLDELPQLINVLKGDMSLVGPRPHALAHDSYYGDRIPQYENRHLVRPGLTGLAQVKGIRGETPHTSDMERRVALDAEYVETASMLGDLRLLFATPREMLNSKAAV